MDTGESSNLRLSNKLLNFSYFSSIVHRFSLKFKDEELEQKYPKKSISPLDSTILFKIFLYASILFIGFRRVLMVILAFSKSSLIGYATSEELINFGLFIAAVVLEAIIFLVKPLQILRGLFIMSYLYFSTAFSSYYADKDTLYSNTMYLPFIKLGELLSTFSI